MKKIKIGLILIIYSLFLMVPPVLANVMSSANYQIESDSINFGGGLGSSVNYNIESSIGESGTGLLSSISYFGSMGYLQSTNNSSSFCNNNNICESVNGENPINCPNDCVISVCNNNGTCEPSIGETIANCGDCHSGGGGGAVCNNNGTCEPSIGETIANCGDCQESPTTTTPTTTESFLIFNILVRSVTTSSAEIVWETSQNAICGLSWGVTIDYLSGSSAGLNYFFNHVRPITNLQASSTYHYKIFCQDQNNNKVESSDNIFTTIYGLDKSSPGNVIGLRSVPNNKKISLFWINPSDYDFAGVIIRRSTNFYPTLTSGVEVYNGMGNFASNGEVFFDDLGLVNDVWYYYSVFAYDTSGNFSSGAAIAGRPFEKEAETPTTTPTTTPPEIPTTTPPEIPTSTTTPPEMPIITPTTTSPTIKEYDLFFRDFDFNQDGKVLEVKLDQVDVELNKQLNISLKQLKVIPGTDRMILYFSGKNGIETYLFSYDASSQTYLAGLPIPKEIGRYNVNIILLDEQENKIGEVSGWIKVESQEEKIIEVVDKVSKTIVTSVKSFYDTIEPVSDFAKSDSGKTLAGITIGVSATNLFLAVPWWNWFFLQFLFTQPWALFFSKKRKGWGTVYNSITKKPIDLALVRLYDVESKQLLKSRVTDANGRYMFLVDEGNYYLQVQKPGFDFPSKLLNGAKEDDSYIDLYYGEEFLVKTEERGVVIANIPLDQQEINLTDKQILKKHFKLKNLWRLSYLGPVFAIVYFIAFPSILAGLFVGLHLLLLLFFRRLAEGKKKLKNWGKVYEKGSKKPLSKAVTRIISPEYNRMLEFYVTDNSGRYGFLADNNKYYVTADKDGYDSAKSNVIDLSNKKNSDFIIAQDLVLNKTNKNSLKDDNNYNEPINKEQKSDEIMIDSNNNNPLSSDKPKDQLNENNKLPPIEDIWG